MNSKKNDWFIYCDGRGGGGGGGGERESGAMISPITKVETMLLSIILDRRIQQLVVCFKLRIYGRGIMELKYVRHGPSLGWTVLVDL